MPSLQAFVCPAFAQDVLDDEGKPFTRFDALEPYINVALGFYDPGAGVHICRHELATRAAFLERKTDADVVLFATHARALDTEPLDSYIALADGRLTVRDIATTRLDAQLVILAACETGLGPITGDGVNGLARFFLCSGTPSLITSLREAPMISTGRQLARFHRAWLKEGSSKAEALRTAQREALDDYRYSIRAWAPFTLIGGWR